MGILSIQSQVVAGYVGNSAAVFALQVLGAEVWPVPTILLSHHPGHGGARGAALHPDVLRTLLEGLAAHGCFGRCEAVISGYLASGETGAVVCDAVMRARAENRGAVYLCDPVLGDDGRTYVSPDVVTAMHNLAAMADILTPNAYEVSLLSGLVFDDRAGALAALRALQGLGPNIVILSSFSGSDTPSGRIDVLAIDGAAAWRLSLPEIGAKFSGAGDVFAAVFLNFWLVNRKTDEALGAACSALHGVLLETAKRGADELALVAAQGLLKTPPQIFAPERLA